MREIFQHYNLRDEQRLGAFYMFIPPRSPVAKSRSRAPVAQFIPWPVEVGMDSECHAIFSRGIHSSIDFHTLIELNLLQ